MGRTLNNVTIRQETYADFCQIEDVIRLAFNDVVDSDHTDHLLVERLRHSDAYVPELSLLAEAGGTAIGHILLSKVKVASDGNVCTVLSVAPLSVLPEFQGRGVGGMLVGEAHKRALRLGYGAVLLLGHQDYYPRFGYRRAADFGIKFPFDAPDECCMAMELKPGGLDGVHGTVRYPDAFNIKF